MLTKALMVLLRWRQGNVLRSDCVKDDCAKSSKTIPQRNHAGMLAVVGIQRSRDFKTLLSNGLTVGAPRSGRSVGEHLRSPGLAIALTSDPLALLWHWPWVF